MHHGNRNMQNTSFENMTTSIDLVRHCKARKSVLCNCGSFCCVVYTFTGLCVTPGKEQDHTCENARNESTHPIQNCSVTFCDGILCNRVPNICIVGTRAFAHGKVVMDNTTAEVCPTNDASCAVFKLQHPDSSELEKSL